MLVCDFEVKEREKDHLGLQTKCKTVFPCSLARIAKYALAFIVMHNLLAAFGDKYIQTPPASNHQKLLICTRRTCHLPNEKVAYVSL